MICQTLPNIESRLPLLVTGIAGVAGYNAFQYFLAKHPGQVIGTRRADYWPLHGEGIVGCDVEDRDSLKRLFDKHQFRSVLNSGGSCKLKSCELDPTLAWRANVEGVESLIDVASRDVRIVHISIDLVYSGEGGGEYIEDQPTDPVTIYGKTMVIAEELFGQHRPDVCTLRISLPMGVSFNGHAGAIDWIQSRFKKSKPATLYFDEVRTPTYTDCLNQVFEHVLAGDLSGIYHAGGPRRLSLYQIAQIVNRVGGYDPKLLQGCVRFDAGPIPPRAGNVSMDSSKLEMALGYQPFDPWPLFDAHMPTDPDWHYDRSNGISGSPNDLAQLLYRNPRFTSDATEC